MVVAAAALLALPSLLHYDPHAGRWPSLPAVSLRGGLVRLRLSTDITGGTVSPRKMGSMIRRLREANYLTQAELAKKVGVTQSYIAQLESGRKTSPSLERLKKLAKVLDVNVSALLE